MEQRRAVFQTFAWFYDMHKRGHLDLNPPYQRRSVWNEEYKSFFLDTVLNNYPCPAIFLFEDISADGTARYKVVDGKQRLSTLIDFVQGNLRLGEDASITALRGKSFNELEDNYKLRVWRYQFSVEFIPQESDAVINNIFDRINRNVARLTFQELRHARLNGSFITEVERQTEWMAERLPPKFPNITAQAKRQMKDVETTATLFLFLEQGEASTSQADLDDAFVIRDTEWDHSQEIVSEFQSVVEYIAEVLRSAPELELHLTRLRNQADFYSLFAAVAELKRQGTAPVPSTAARKLRDFLDLVDSVPEAQSDKEARYLGAARSASNDRGPRRTRIDIIKFVLTT